MDPKYFSGTPVLSHSSMQDLYEENEKLRIALLYAESRRSAMEASRDRCIADLREYEAKEIARQGTRTISSEEYREYRELREVDASNDQLRFSWYYGCYLGALSAGATLFLSQRSLGVFWWDILLKCAGFLVLIPLLIFPILAYASIGTSNLAHSAFIRQRYADKKPTWLYALCILLPIVVILIVRLTRTGY